MRGGCGAGGVRAAVGRFGCGDEGAPRLLLAEGAACAARVRGVYRAAGKVAKILRVDQLNNLSRNKKQRPLRLVPRSPVEYYFNSTQLLASVLLGHHRGAANWAKWCLMAMFLQSDFELLEKLKRLK